MIVKEYLVWNYFIRGYSEWAFHEGSILPSPFNWLSYIKHTSNFGSSNPQRNPIGEDNIRGLLRDAFTFGAANLGDFNRE